MTKQEIKQAIEKLINHSENGGQIYGGIGDEDMQDWYAGMIEVFRNRADRPIRELLETAERLSETTCSYSKGKLSAIVTILALRGEE